MPAPNNTAHENTRVIFLPVLPHIFSTSSMISSRFLAKLCFTISQHVYALRNPTITIITDYILQLPTSSPDCSRPQGMLRTVLPIIVFHILNTVAIEDCPAFVKKV